jgi:hypothetical protein
MHTYPPHHEEKCEFRIHISADSGDFSRAIPSFSNSLVETSRLFIEGKGASTLSTPILASGRT